MQKNEKLIGMLNDLLRINNDRFEGYKMALKATKDSDQDLKMLFYKMADESRQNTSALISQLLKLRSTTSTGASITGSIYSGWLQSKTGLNATDRHSMLDYCAHMEAMITDAYENAARIDAEIPANIYKVLLEQKNKLKRSYGVVNRYHGLYETIAA